MTNLLTSSDHEGKGEKYIQIYYTVIQSCTCCSELCQQHRGQCLTSCCAQLVSKYVTHIWPSPSLLSEWGRSFNLASLFELVNIEIVHQRHLQLTYHQIWVRICTVVCTDACTDKNKEWTVPQPVTKGTPHLTHCESLSVFQLSAEENSNTKTNRFFWNTTEKYPLTLSSAVRVDTALWLWSLYAGRPGPTGRAKNQTKRQFCLFLHFFGRVWVVETNTERDVHWGIYDRFCWISASCPPFTGSEIGLCRMWRSFMGNHVLWMHAVMAKVQAGLFPPRCSSLFTAFAPWSWCRAKS